MVGTRKVIITVAPTGGTATRQTNPYVPTQPRDIAKDVAECCAAGASVAALHARRPDDLATCNGEIYRQMNNLIRAECDIVLNNSTGGGADGDMVLDTTAALSEVVWEERLKGLEGGADICTADTMTFTLTTADGREVVMNTPPSRCRELLKRMQGVGIKPEWEAFCHHHLLQDSLRLINDGFDHPPHIFNLVFGLDRAFQGALPYRPDFLQQMVGLLPKNAVFGVSCIGAEQVNALSHAIVLGGHIRVGIEDHPYLPNGALASNVQLVKHAVALVRAHGLEPAKPAEARALLGLDARGVQ